MIRPELKTVRTSLPSFKNFINNPLVQNRNIKSVRHPSANLTTHAQAKLSSYNQPRVQIASIGASNASKRSATFLNGLTPRLKKYGLSTNSGGKSGILGPRKVSGRLSGIYRASST